MFDVDTAPCKIYYVDGRAHAEGPVTIESLPSSDSQTDAQTSFNTNLSALIAIFGEVTICSSGSSCLAKLGQINTISRSELVPALVLVDIPPRRKQSYTDFPPRHDSGVAPEYEDDAFCGLPLLEHIANEVQASKISKLVVPIGVITDGNHAESMPLLATDINRCLNAGAADVLQSPFSKSRAEALLVHACRAMKLAGVERSEFISLKRDRQLSWVGVEEEKPYAYLREQMVSGLMDGICKPESSRAITETTLPAISSERFDEVAEAVGRWHFSAHSFSEEELLHGAFCIFKHASSLPELEQWAISSSDLSAFLNACHAAYNSFVPYHNFRHVVDVLQAAFHFLLRTNVLPPYRNVVYSPKTPTHTHVISVMRPFDALALLITAIGHDVGHPGVNNAFLVALNAPLAQLYNDRSVLESFHCAAFSQILRRYWPAVFASTEMRKSIINSILATDMAVHFDYMKRMGILHQQLENGADVRQWDTKTCEDTRALLSALLIKCADISNVARNYSAAANWAVILTDEFARQADMEKEVGIPSQLFAPPIQDSIIELGKSQLAFMKVFALPLFSSVTDILPEMRFTIDEIAHNQGIWTGKIEAETAKLAESTETKPSSSASILPLSAIRASSGTENVPPVKKPVNHTDRQAFTQTNGDSTHANGTSRQQNGSPTLGYSSPLSKQRPNGFNLDKQLPQIHSEPFSFGFKDSEVQSGNDSDSTVLATHSHSRKEGNGRPSEHSSVPSNDRNSGITSATHTPYSPSTNATSVMSLSDSSKSDRPRTSPATITDSTQDINAKKANELLNKSMHRKPSRFKLNFWKSKRKTPAAVAP